MLHWRFLGPLLVPFLWQVALSICVDPSTSLSVRRLPLQIFDVSRARYGHQALPESGFPGRALNDVVANVSSAGTAVQELHPDTGATSAAIRPPRLTQFLINCF